MWSPDPPAWPQHLLSLWKQQLVSISCFPSHSQNQPYCATSKVPVTARDSLSSEAWVWTPHFHWEPPPHWRQLPCPRISSFPRMSQWPVAGWCREGKARPLASIWDTSGDHPVPELSEGLVKASGWQPFWRSASPLTQFCLRHFLTSTAP